MVIRRGLRAVIAVAALALGAVILPTAPAQAAPPEILVSTDGVNFMPATAVNIFDDLGLMVPGDAMTGQLWVRNHSSTTALVRVAVTDLMVSSPAFGSAVTLSSTMNGVTSASSLGALTDCQVVVQTQTLTAGDTVRVDFEASMSSVTSGRDAQGETADLGFIVTAHDEAAGPFTAANGCSASAIGGPGGNPSLAWTGGGDVLPTLFVALALLTLGALFAMVRRRRRDDETRRS